MSINKENVKDIKLIDKIVDGTQQITYDNSISGLSATTLKGAIDEVKSIASTPDALTGLTLVGNNLTYVDELNNQHVINLSQYLDNTDKFVVSGSVSGGTLTLSLNDSSVVNIDVSSLIDDTNTYVVSGVVSNNNLILSMNNGTTITVDLSTTQSNARELVGAITYDMSGFPNLTDSSISFNEGTRVFTLSPTNGSFKVWSKGKEITINGPKTLTIANTTGGRYIKYNTSTNQLEEVAINVNPDILNNVLVSYIFWEATNQKAIIFAEERHSSHRDTQWHLSQHLDVGAIWRSGAALSYTLDDNDVSVGLSAPLVIADEDLVHTITHSATPSGFYQQTLEGQAVIPTIYLNGSTVIQSTASTQPWIKGTQRVQYNPLDSSNQGSLSEVNNGSYVSYWLIATNDTKYPIKAIMGHHVHTTIAEAEAEQFDSFGFSVPELVPLYQIILKSSTTSTSGCYIHTVFTLTSRKSTSTTGFSAASHENLTDRSSPNQHPIDAITGLQVAIDAAKQQAVDDALALAIALG